MVRKLVALKFVLWRLLVLWELLVLLELLVFVLEMDDGDGSFDVNYW